MSDELIWKDRGIHGDIDQVDGESGNFGEHYSTQRVCHREGGALEDEIASILLDLGNRISLKAIMKSS